MYRSLAKTAPARAIALIGFALSLLAIVYAPQLQWLPLVVGGIIGAALPGVSPALPAKAPPLRDYGIGAQILNDLGVKDMILLSNHKRNIVGLEAFGLNIVEQREIEGKAEMDA